MNQKIRWATLADVDDLIQLRFAYFADEQILITPEQQSTIEANLRTYIDRHLAVDFFTALVYADGQIAATAYLAIIERPANLS